MSTLELVIDGTDGAGKTQLTAHIVKALSARSWVVATHAPYRVQEVHDLWAHEPVRAATIISGIMRELRHVTQSDVIVWDRGWPTAYVSTADPKARALFLPFPTLTVLLLNHETATLAKGQAQGIQTAWYVDAALRRRYQRAYRALPNETSAPLLAFEADARGLFQFAELSAQIMRALDESLRI